MNTDANQDDAELEYQIADYLASLEPAATQAKCVICHNHWWMCYRDLIPANNA